MIYNLILIIFMSNGVEYKVPLSRTYDVETCVELRDHIRGKIEYLNNLPVKSEYKGSDVEFVEADCEAQQIFY